MDYNRFLDLVYFYDDLFEVEGPINGLEIKGKVIIIGDDGFKLTDDAFKLALRRIGISGTLTDFTRRNGEADYEFIQEAINRKLNYWNIRPSKILTDGKTAYSVMSTRYQRVKHEVVLNRLSKMINIERYFDEKRSYVSDRSMLIFLKGIKEFEIENDSEYLFGVSVRNSQTGWGSLRTSQFIERLVCSNGMTSKLVSSSLSLYHVGAVRDEFSRVIERYLNPQPVVELLQTAVKKPALVSVPENIPKILSRFGVKKEHHEGIVKAWEQERDLGLGPFGIANAITRYNDHNYLGSSSYNSDEYYELSMIAMEMLSY